MVIGAHNPYQAKNGSALRIRQHLEVLRVQGAETFYWGLGEGGEGRKNARVLPIVPWSNLSLVRKLLLVPKLLFSLVIGIDPNVSFLYTRKRAKDFEAAVRDFQPTHLLVSESWMHLFVESIRSGLGLALHITFDLHNVESILRRDMGRKKSWWNRLLTSWRSSVMFEAEWEMCNLSDVTWVCSRDDAVTVASIYLVSAKVVSNKVDLSLYENLGVTTGIRSFGMVGIWSYEPNGQAADILLDVVWPEIGKSVPVLVGKNPTVAMLKAAGHGALVTGEVDDVRPSLGRIRTMVIPLTAGGGTRMKVLEAFAAGIPVVATAKAVEGLEVTHLTDCIICEPAEMAGWVLKLWDSPGLEKVLRNNARDLVRLKYSWGSVEP